MPNFGRKLTLFFFGFGWLPQAAFAQSTDDSGWSYRIAPYLWGTAIDGNVAHERLPVELHGSMSFGDVWEHLDIGAMGAFEARKDNFGVLSDAMLAKLSTRSMRPSPAPGSRSCSRRGPRPVWSHSSIADGRAGPGTSI